MRIIIAGGRDMDNWYFFNQIIEMTGIDSGETSMTSLVLGGATGVDALADRWAREMEIPFMTYPAQWRRYNKKAGPIRNELMAQNADGLIAIWNGFSRGTKNMIKLAKDYNLLSAIYYYKTREEKINGRTIRQHEFIESRISRPS